MMKPKRKSPRVLRNLGGPVGIPRCCVFGPERRGDPLGAYPSLQREGLPFNRWLTGHILDPVLERWSRPARDGRPQLEAVLNDVDWASGRVRLAFQENLAAATRLGEPAILAAMSVSANLQRTLALLGEFMLDDAPPPGPPIFRLSRLWCGLVDYPKESDYFIARVRRPVPPSKLRAHRRDNGHLRNAFWCSSREIEARCAESIGVLREEIRRTGLFTPDDLRHLHSPSIPGRSGQGDD